MDASPLERVVAKSSGPEGSAGDVEMKVEGDAQTVGTKVDEQMEVEKQVDTVVVETAEEEEESLDYDRATAKVFKWWPARRSGLVVSPSLLHE